jgi:5-histidylcysteine sulfoxide synthase/putative 4-mercaptohistidine N1-methyltranferase
VNLNTVDLINGEVEAKRNEIKEYFNSTYALYEELFEVLVDDGAYYERPCKLRHPLIFYFGHTATFFINKLMIGKFISKRVNAQFESMFAIGVDEMSWDDLHEGHYDWPSVDVVRAYRQEVKDVINDYIDSVTFTMPIDWESPLWVIMMGIEHERIHLETSSVLIRQLDLKWVKPHQTFPINTTHRATPINTLLTVHGGDVTLGLSQPSQFYGWDNEYGFHQATIETFEASKFLVSNGEFMAFINEGGYTNDTYWSEEGKGWRDHVNAVRPQFWVEKEGKLYLRTMAEEIALPLDWPVEVNYLEAKAFCEYKSEKLGKTIRLPSEDEYTLLADHVGVKDNDERANINLQQGASSTSVDRNAFGEFYDVTGNVWQWSETPIYPYEGFEVHPLYDDFTTPTYDNQHNLILGGSWISTGNEAMRQSRYAFRRHFYQHAGFRYVASESMVKTDFDVYETDDLVAQYCEFHYGDTYFNVPNFSKVIAAIAKDAVALENRKKALDLGCSVGRATFELSRHFDEVTGLDFSARFIQVGNQLKEKGNLRYTIPTEGELVEFKELSLDHLGLGARKDRVAFFQQDATNLKPHFTGYDLVVAANLIDRLYNPMKFLNEIKDRINPNGVLVITSPYTWLEEYTPKDKWLGGLKQDGENITTIARLKEVLLPHFTLVQEPHDVPFVIRETARKYQHTLAQVSVWKKRSTNKKEG